jgi:molecular chaperone GrpE
VVDAKPEVEAEVSDWEEQAERLQAEIERVRTFAEQKARELAERKVSMLLNQERQRLLTRLLSVADNLERALDHADENDALRAGVQLSLDDLRKQLAQEGVEPIQAQGQTFDPNLHEAVATDGSDGRTIVQVLQTGYLLQGELLRPSRVVVGSDNSSDAE